MCHINCRSKGSTMVKGSIYDIYTYACPYMVWPWSCSGLTKCSGTCRDGEVSHLRALRGHFVHGQGAQRWYLSMVSRFFSVWHIPNVSPCVWNRIVESHTWDHGETLNHNGGVLYRTFFFRSRAQTTTTSTTVVVSGPSKLPASLACAARSATGQQISSCITEMI